MLREDKVSAAFILGTVSGTASQITAFRGGLSATDGSNGTGNPTRQGWTFCAPSLDYQPIPIRKRALDSGSEPLFAGVLKTKGFFGSGQSGRIQAGLAATLHLNPSRYARHGGQDVFAGIVAPSRQEQSFDDSDNWLTQNQAAGFTAERWRAQARSYYGRTLSHLVQEFRRVADYPTADCVLPPHLEAIPFSLHSAEHYVEFHSLNPLGLVAEIGRTLRSFPAFQLRQFSDRLDPQNCDGCPSILAELRGGVFLKCYAKTNERVRLEISHDLKSACPEGLTMQGIGLSEFMAKLEILRQRATLWLNQSLSAMNTARTIPFPHLTAFQLAYEVGKTLSGLGSSGDMMLNLLQAGFGIRQKAEPDWRESIQRLKKAGILEYCQLRRCNVPTAKWRGAWEQLKGQSFAFMQPRVRTRVRRLAMA